MFYGFILAGVEVHLLRFICLFVTSSQPICHVEFDYFREAYLY